jgi:hypothetical protein
MAKLTSDLSIRVDTTGLFPNAIPGQVELNDETYIHTSRIGGYLEKLARQAQRDSKVWLIPREEQRQLKVRADVLLRASIELEEDEL